MGLNYLSIHKLQWLHHRSLKMDKESHPTSYDWCDYLPMPILELIHISKKGFSCSYNPQNHHGQVTSFIDISIAAWCLTSWWVLSWHIQTVSYPITYTTRCQWNAAVLSDKLSLCSWWYWPAALACKPCVQETNIPNIMWCEYWNWENMPLISICRTLPQTFADAYRN